MSRDHRKLRVFATADALVVQIYGFTKPLPPEERYGLQAQIRRSAVSVPTNIVEGAARQSEADYLRFLVIALGSARECEYLVGLAARLGFANAASAAPLVDQYAKVAASLLRLTEALQPADA